MEKSGQTTDELPPPVISADQAAFHAPPPSYEEVMGVFQTSLKGTAPEPPQLSYIDIMPRCIHPGNIRGKVPPTFTNFSSIMDGANRWLLDNPGLAVWKCESINRLLSVAADGSITYDLNEMIRRDTTFGFSVFIKGVRLWLTKAQPGCAPQQIGLRNVAPEKKVIDIPAGFGGFHRRGRIIIGGDFQAWFGPYSHSFATFEGLEETVNRLNKRLKDDPIPGTILTVETDTVKAFDKFKNTLDPESCCWAENKEQFMRVTQVLRIFYVKGPSAEEQIGIQDFVPAVVEQPELTRSGKFEEFNDVVTKIAHWIPANQGNKVVNIQQFDARVHRNYIGNQELSVSSDSTDDIISSFSERRMAKTLRVFYISSSSKGAPINANYLSSRLFLPVRLGTTQFETMTQTMDRIDCWLKVSGQMVYSVETVQLLFNTYKQQGADGNRSDYNLNALSGKHWVTAIRVYFPSPFAEPDPALLPPVPSFTNRGSASCTIV